MRDADDTDDAEDTDEDAGQSDPYVSAMLRRRHKIILVYAIEIKGNNSSEMICRVMVLSLCTSSHDLLPIFQVSL